MHFWPSARPPMSNHRPGLEPLPNPPPLVQARSSRRRNQTRPSVTGAVYRTSRENAVTLRDSIVAARLSGPLPQSNGVTIFEFRFSADDSTFAGHFPNRPLLPGVFQLELTRMAAQWVLDCSLSIREVSKAKFTRPILPGELLRLELKLSSTQPATDPTIHQSAPPTLPHS